MPLVKIKRSVEIDTPVEKVFSIIDDFNHWTIWSPWLILEPEASTKVSEGNKFYEWEGRRSGTGNMRIISQKENEYINIDLAFLKPWKTKSKVRFEFNSTGVKTNVTWFMEMKMPFFFFFIKRMMEAYIGMDYERGLRLLKDYAEDGIVHSSLNFKGEEHFSGCGYIGIRTQCTKETMGKKMGEDLPKIMEFIAKSGLKIQGDVFTQYEKWDLVRNKIRYVSGVAVDVLPDELPEGFIKGNIPATKVYAVEHMGPYHHLGNAWSALYSMQRSKDFKLNKKIHPFETYLNHPGEISQNELITKIHFPIK